MAAGFTEILRIFACDFLKCLKTVGRKPRCYDRDIFYTGFRQRLNGLVGIGGEPFRTAETRLKCQLKLLLVEFEAFAQETRGLPRTDPRKDRLY